MGICVSCDTTADGAATARVVLPTGELREYARPATAASALEEEGAGDEGHFVCDADAMGFEGFVAAVGADEELRRGQIYFILPDEMRRRRLTGEEVAALAVKASTALMKAAGGGGRRRRGVVAPLVFPPPDEEEVAAAVPMKPAVAVKRRVGCGGGRRRFSPDLTAIPECE